MTDVNWLIRGLPARPEHPVILSIG